MERGKIHDALEKAIDGDPLKQKAFDDIQGITGTPDQRNAQREALIDTMSDEMSHKVGFFRAAFTKMGAIDRDPEKNYERIDGKFEEALHKAGVTDDTLAKAIAAEASRNYVSATNGKDIDHPEAMNALVTKGIDLEVKNGIDEAFAKTIPDALHKTPLPGFMADKAMEQLREGINKDELAIAVSTAIKDKYPSDEFKNASPEARHEIIAAAVRTEFEKHDVISLKQTDIGQAGLKLLDVADGLSKSAGLDLGLAKHAETFEKIARDAAGTAISGEVADKVVPGGNGSTQKNLMAGAGVAAHEAIGEITHGLSGLFGGGKGPLAIG
jgi:hypothetical protein